MFYLSHVILPLFLNSLTSLLFLGQAPKLLVFLDFPWPLCLYRALKRTWELRHSNRAELTSCSERNAFWPLLKTLWLYQKTTRKRILSELQDKSHVRFRMPSQLARWQNTVLSSGKPVVLGCEGQAGNSSQRRKS